jgi:nicotinamidase-related amidase
MSAQKILFVLVPIVLLAMWAIPGTGDEKERLELKPVLLVIDVQNAYWPLMSEEDRNTAPEKINEVIALFREFGLPVIRVYHSDPKRGPEPGTERFEFVGSIAVTGDDPKVIKSRPSAFVRTDLEQMLKEADRNIVFLCGLSATGCVLATYFGAEERDFMAFMVEDALLSRNSSNTKAIEDICSSLPIEKVREVLEDPYL